jgi:hypothetical protein
MVNGAKMANAGGNAARSDIVQGSANRLAARVDVA